MDIIETTINGVDVIIEGVDFSSKRPTGASDTFGGQPKTRVVDKAFDKMEPVIKALARIGSGALYGDARHPDEMELSFSMGFSSEFGKWAIKAGGESTFNVTMKWDKSVERLANKNKTSPSE